MAETATASTETPAARAARKRQRILEAAGHCFASDGFVKTTVEEIARQAGVSKGLVYVHFRGKDELLAEVLDKTLVEWREVTWAEVDRQAHGVLETIAVMHRTSIAYARSHPVLSNILNRDAGMLLSLNDARTRESMDAWRQQLIDLLRGGVRSGELRPELDVERAADVIRLLHLAFLDRLFIPNPPNPIDTADDRLVEASIDLLLHGMARRRRRRH